MGHLNLVLRLIRIWTLWAALTHVQKTWRSLWHTWCTIIICVCGLTIQYRSTIAGSSKNNYKNKKRTNYKILKTEKQNRIDYFCNLLLFLSQLRSFILIFALKKQFFWEIQFFERQNLRFFKINKYLFARWRSCYGVMVYNVMYGIVSHGDDTNPRWRDCKTFLTWCKPWIWM